MIKGEIRTREGNGFKQSATKTAAGEDNISITGTTT